jgi:LuxR family maltose regulon positive regulatory protein
MVELLREAEQVGDAGGHARRLLRHSAARDGEATESPQRPALSLALPSAESLSERELQVLRLLGSELSGPQIARELFVSNNTLRTHTKHIFTKLNVTSRRAAVRRAREEGLI